MSLYRSIGGQVRAELTSADIPGFLAAAGKLSLHLRDLQMENELTVRFTLERSSLGRLSALAYRRGERLQILGRWGIFWKAAALVRRPVLTAGLGLLAALTLFLPSRILLVEVQGNAVISENRILETAAQCGIRFWASRREVRSEGMKNALLEAMPELSWAGINTYGSRAVITVREGRDGGEETEPPLVSSIVAALDGFILSCQAERGTALCAPGQGVKAGDVLISGYTDCGLCVTATRSLGEVMAVTQRQIAAITPADCLKKGARKGEEVTYSLILGKFRINFDNNSGISPPGCGRMVTEYTLTLPGNFSLPVKLQKQTVNGYALTKTDVAEDAAGALLSRFAADHLQAQMIAGAVTEALETIHAEDGRWVLTGNYACTEMIGRERAEQNGE